MNDRQDLLDQAIRVLRREIPEDLEWFFRQPLPPLRWARDQAAMDGRLIKAWLVTAIERNDPQANAEQRRRALRVDPSDRQALAKWLLSTWMRHDTERSEITEARRVELHQMAEKAAELARRFGRDGQDAAERYRQLVEQESAQQAPSALPYRGVLAWVAACAAESTFEDEIASSVERYVATWQDRRPDQCQALLSMLASLS